MGVKGSLLSWFESYLENRHQRVVIENRMSNLSHILAGVPQGSILGPLLFLIFINDIDQNVNSCLSLFADDTALVHIFSNAEKAENVINKDMRTLTSWSKSWFIKFNPIKTKYMIISNKKGIMKSKLNLLLKFCTPLDQVSNHKHLGLTFSDDLKWSNHIDNIVKSANRKIGLLYRCRDKIKRKDKIKIYTSIIRPSIEYASVIYHNCSLSDSKKIESLQKFAARVCTGAMRRTEYKALLRELGWESLKTRRLVSKGLLTFKIIKGHTPHFLKSNFAAPRQTSRPSRNPKRFEIPFSKLNSYALSFFPSQTLFWNELSDEIVNCSSISLFRQAMLKKYDEFADTCNDCNAYHSCNSYYGKILTQIRLGLSPLRLHMFEFQLTDNPICPSCRNEIESVSHLFLNCSMYNTDRNELFCKLNRLVVNWTILKNKEKIDLLINGHKLDVFTNRTFYSITSENIVIFKLVCDFLKSIRRFAYSINLYNIMPV